MRIVYIGPTAVIAQGQGIAIFLVNVTSCFSSTAANEGVDYAACEGASCVIGRSPQLVVPGCTILQGYLVGTIHIVHYAGPRGICSCQAHGDATFTKQANITLNGNIFFFCISVEVDSILSFFTSLECFKSIIINALSRSSIYLNGTSAIEVYNTIISYNYSSTINHQINVAINIYCGATIITPICCKYTCYTIVTSSTTNSSISIGNAIVIAITHSELAIYSQS